MNRIQHFVEEELNSSALQLATEAELPPQPASDAESSHCIFTPLHYERNYAYPLIVWLWPSAEGTNRLRQLMPAISERNYFGASLPDADKRALIEFIKTF